MKSPDHKPNISELHRIVAGVVDATQPGVIKIFTENEDSQELHEIVAPYVPSVDLDASPDVQHRTYAKISSRSMLNGHLAMSFAKTNGNIEGSESYSPRDRLLASYTSSFKDDLKQPHAYIVARRHSGKLKLYRLAWGTCEAEDQESFIQRKKNALHDRLLLEEAAVALGRFHGPTRLSYRAWYERFFMGVYFYSRSLLAFGQMSEATKQSALTQAEKLYQERKTVWEAIPLAVHSAQAANGGG